MRIKAIVLHFNLLLLLCLMSGLASANTVNGKSCKQNLAPIAEYGDGSSYTHNYIRNVFPESTTVSEVLEQVQRINTTIDKAKETTYRYQYYDQRAFAKQLKDIVHNCQSKCQNLQAARTAYKTAYFIRCDQIMSVPLGSLHSIHQRIGARDKAWDMKTTPFICQENLSAKPKALELCKSLTEAAPTDYQLPAVRVATAVAPRPARKVLPRVATPTPQQQAATQMSPAEGLKKIEDELREANSEYVPGAW